MTTQYIQGKEAHIAQGLILGTDLGDATKAHFGAHLLVPAAVHDEVRGSQQCYVFTHCLSHPRLLHIRTDQNIAQLLLLLHQQLAVACAFDSPSLSD